MLIATNKVTNATLHGDYYVEDIVDRFITDSGGSDNVLINQAALNQHNTELAKMNTDYNGVSVSLTSKDATGLLQVKTAFELGATRTIFNFENGTKMEMTPATFAGFAPWFVAKRNEFFQ